MLVVIVVVVAVDTRWLAASLSKGLLTLTTTATGNGAQPTAFDYLEKIFQLSAPLPELSPDSVIDPWKARGESSEYL